MKPFVPFLFPLLCAVSAVAATMTCQAMERANQRKRQAADMLSHGNDCAPSSTLKDCAAAVLLSGLFLVLIILTFSAA